MRFDASTIDSLAMLALGFAFAGLLASALELTTERRASFSLLTLGPPAALAWLPLVIFCAPFIILRNALRGRRFEKRSAGAVMAATIVAGFWSLVCGRLVLDAVRLAGAL